MAPRMAKLSLKPRSSVNESIMPIINKKSGFKWHDVIICESQPNGRHREQHITLYEPDGYDASKCRTGLEMKTLHVLYVNYDNVLQDTFIEKLSMWMWHTIQTIGVFHHEKQIPEPPFENTCFIFNELRHSKVYHLQQCNEKDKVLSASDY